MDTFNQKLSSQWKDTANLVLGLWLAVSPWALSYAGGTTPAWNAHIAGVIIRRRRSAGSTTPRSRCRNRG
jgi:SPW repeat